MSNTELFVFIFADHLLATMLVPFHYGYVNLVMKEFALSINLITQTLAVCGALVGALLNYGFGNLMARLIGKEWFTKQHRLVYYTTLIILPLLTLIWLPVVGGWISFFAGLFLLRLHYVVIIVVGSQSIYQLLYFML